MRRAVRGDPPALLARHGAEIGREYAQKRETNPSFEFRWPQRDNQSMGQVAAQALSEMTQGRCSYCDGYPINALSQRAIDHFRPKSRPQFYTLVCTWTNLFLCCAACNGAKGAQWNDDLLSPDAQDFTFERYFEYRSDTGELHPSPAPTDHDRRRAEKTIQIFDLNRAEQCIDRRRTVRALQRAQRDDPDDLPYRYLAGLIAP